MKKEIDYTDTTEKSKHEHTPERRSGKDRRRRPTNPFSFRTFKGNRRGGRREGDDDRFVDKYSDRLFIALIIILVLCAFDGVATIYHIIHGTAVEFNPIMDFAIKLGSGKFIFVKLALTFACLLMLVFHRHARGVKKIVVFIIFLYLLLTIYHLFIFNMSLSQNVLLIYPDSFMKSYLDVGHAIVKPVLETELSTPLGYTGLIPVEMT